MIGKSGRLYRLFRWGISTKNGHDVFDRDNKQLVVGFEIHGDGVFRMKQDLVVLL